MIHQEDIVPLTLFAEQHYCKECKMNPCEIFTRGDYDQCPGLMSAFEKNTAEYHAFMNSVQKKRKHREGPNPCEVKIKER